MMRNAIIPLFFTLKNDTSTEKRINITPDHKYIWVRCLVGEAWSGATSVSIRKEADNRPSAKYNQG